MYGLKEISSNRLFGGYQKVFSHESKETSSQMNIAVYLPPQAEVTKVPVIFWLSGLTCNELNFVQKSGAQRYAAEHGVMIVCPDTSPRGLGIPGEDESYDFGTGAGFYVDATVAPYDKNYRMFSYITKELPEVIMENFPAVPGAFSIMGHSMGGHGAIVCAFRSGLYQSVSAFAPICNPIKGKWGRKALAGYLGAEEAGNWADYDSTELVKKYSGPPLEIYIEQGKDDEYLEKDLIPENLIAACKESHTPFVYQLHEGYDHSYFFVSTFIGQHIAYHAKHLAYHTMHEKA